MQNNVPAPVPKHIIHPNLNLPPPPPFSGSPLELPIFKLKLLHFLVGNRNTYLDARSQLLYAGQLLQGPTYQWYRAIVDPNTIQLHPSYDLTRFFEELEDFSGGAFTLHSRERSPDMLRHTGTVSELAIAFQNITHTFSPRWPDHPLTYLFSRKLKEYIRFELTAPGSLPPTCHAYLAAAILVEQNQACRSQLPLPPLLPATSSPPHSSSPPSSWPSCPPAPSQWSPAHGSRWHPGLQGCTYHG